MGDVKPDEEMGQPADLDASQEDPWAVLVRARAAFADVPEEVHQAEIDRIIAEIRAEARAEAASKGFS